ncbi:hypothetical protein ZIOFF_051617 [Zingiber officinale]|uniref:Uncharacterized protein n=1 Tax=Zingiber officinale TaxID=94328 RepID=A0A8J5FN01_ZINOF|nr:hypothetical protein ZIOFF_051617 [Zingiber officinale]
MTPPAADDASSRRVAPPPPAASTPGGQRRLPLLPMSLVSAGTPHYRQVQRSPLSPIVTIAGPSSRHCCLKRSQPPQPPIAVVVALSSNQRLQRPMPSSLDEPSDLFSHSIVILLWAWSSQSDLRLLRLDSKGSGRHHPYLPRTPVPVDAADGERCHLRQAPGQPSVSAAVDGSPPLVVADSRQHLLRRQRTSVAREPLLPASPVASEPLPRASFCWSAPVYISSGRRWHLQPPTMPLARSTFLLLRYRLLPRLTVRDDDGPIGRRIKDAFLANGKPEVLEKLRIFAEAVAKGVSAKDELDAKKPPSATVPLPAAGGRAPAASPVNNAAAAAAAPLKAKKKKKKKNKEGFKNISLTEKFYCRARDIYEIQMDENRWKIFSRSNARISKEEYKLIIQKWRFGSWPESDGIYSTVKLMSNPEQGSHLSASSCVMLDMT